MVTIAAILLRPSEPRLRLLPGRGIGRVSAGPRRFGGGSMVTRMPGFRVISILDETAFQISQTLAEILNRVLVASPYRNVQITRAPGDSDIHCLPEEPGPFQPPFKFMARYVDRLLEGEAGNNLSTYQKLNFIESCICRAGYAVLAWPKKGELITPIKVL